MLLMWVDECQPRRKSITRVPRPEPPRFHAPPDTAQAGVIPERALSVDKARAVRLLIALLLVPMAEAI